MDRSEPPPPAQDTPRARRIRLVGILVLAAVVGGVAWFTLSAGAASREPGSVFDYVRDRTLAGDGEAAWRMLLPQAREDYTRAVVAVASDPSPSSVEWRRRTGLTPEVVRALPPEKALAREFLAYAEERLQGARVYRTDRWDEETALLYVSLRDGSEAHWQVRRKDGVWRIENLLPLVTLQGRLLPRNPGEAPRKVPVPESKPRVPR